MERRYRLNNIFSRSTLLKRTLISYISIILICVITLTSIIMIFFMKHIKAQLITAQEQNLSILSTKTDDMLTKLNQVAYQLCYNDKLNNPANYASPVGRQTVMKELVNITINSTSEYDCVYYTNVSEYLYTRDTTVTPATFYETLYFHDRSVDYLNELRHADRLKILPRTQVDINGIAREVIPIIFPDTQQGFVQKRGILFLVNAEKFLADPPDPSIALCVVTEDGSIAAASGAPLALADGAAGLGDRQRCRIEGGNYFAFWRDSALKLQRYLLLVPSRYIDEKTDQLFFILIVSLLLIFGLSFVVIEVSLKYNYRPLHMLKKLVEEKTGNKYEDTNEITAIENSVTDMMDSIQSFMDFNTSNKSTFREALLTKLLQGEYRDVERVNSFEKYSNIVFRYRYFCVISLYIHGGDRNEVYQTLLSLETKVEGADIYFKASDMADTYHAILNLDSNEAEPAVQRLHTAIGAAGLGRCTIGISRVTEDISQLWQRYMEAAAALDYRLVKGVGGIIPFEAADGAQADFDYPTQQIETFGLFLKQGSIEKALALLDEILEEVKQNNTSLFAARCVCYDVITTMLKAVNSITPGSIKRQNINIMNFESVEQLTQEAKSFCIQACEAVDSDNVSFNRAIAYIKENFCDADLSVKAVAEQVGISQSSLYGLFKANLSITPLQYINSLQIEHVKELLTTTDLPVNMIVQQIGRFDVSNFIRRFKTQVGMTPGEYRRYYGTAE